MHCVTSWTTNQLIPTWYSWITIDFHSPHLPHATAKVACSTKLSYPSWMKRCHELLRPAYILCHNQVIFALWCTDTSWIQQGHLGYVRDTDFTYKKRTLGYDMTRFIAYFELSGHHRFAVLFYQIITLEVQQIFPYLFTPTGYLWTNNK